MSRITVSFVLVFFTFAAASVSVGAYDRVTPVVKVVEKTQDVVVNIAGKRLMEAPLGFDWSDPFGGSLFGQRQQEVTILGSGVVVHEDGYILTNSHVVKDTDNIKITFNDGAEFSAKIISADPDKDIALLKMDAGKKFNFIHLGRSNDLMVGETVIAIGNPFGYSNTVTSGVISAKKRDIQVSQNFWLRGLIQTDAAINSGNSGGPLLNINGDLIGITTAIRPDAQNIGFAIPIDTINENLAQMLMPEKLRRVQLGLAMGAFETIGKISGLLVSSVVKGSPAEKHSIQPGDLVIKVDGKEITGAIDYFVKLMNKQVNEPINIEYVKPKAPEKILVAKLEMLARPLPDGKKLVDDFFQMEVAELNRDMAQRFGFDRAYPVLVVTGVRDDGAASQSGISTGDLILEINGSSIKNSKELALIMEKISEGDLVDFKVLQIKHHGAMQFQRQYLLELKAQKLPGSKTKSKSKSKPQTARPEELPIEELPGAI
jgi:serine protease Do